MKKILEGRYELEMLKESPLSYARTNALYNIVATVAECFDIDLDPENEENMEAAELLLSKLSSGFDAAGGLYDPYDLPEIEVNCNVIFGDMTPEKLGTTQERLDMFVDMIKQECLDIGKSCTIEDFNS